MAKYGIRACKRAGKHALQHTDGNWQGSGTRYIQHYHTRRKNRQRPISQPQNMRNMRNTEITRKRGFESKHRKHSKHPHEAARPTSRENGLTNRAKAKEEKRKPGTRLKRMPGMSRRQNAVSGA